MFLLISQLQNILSNGFGNKFYSISKMDPGLDEYRINVSSDTPHWYIGDYLARISSQYGISSIEVNGETPLCIYSFGSWIRFRFASDHYHRKMHCSSTSVSSPADLDECGASERVCVQPALCANTYGGYRCVCNGTEVYANQSCVLGEQILILQHYRYVPKN